MFLSFPFESTKCKTDEEGFRSGLRSQTLIQALLQFEVRVIRTTFYWILFGH